MTIVHRNDIAIVAEGHSLCRAGLFHVMERCLRFSKIVACRNWAEIIDAFDRYGVRVSLLVVDYDLPDMQQTAGLRRITDEWPSTRVLVAGELGDRAVVIAVLAAGVHGFVTKSSSSAEMEDALTATTAGQIYVPRLLADEVDHHCGQRLVGVQSMRLTARQQEVLRLLAAGKSNKQIARELTISEGTVKVHVNASFRVLGVHNRVNAASALRELSMEQEDRPTSTSTAG